MSVKKTAVKKEQDNQEPAPVKETLTFWEDDHKALVEFFNLVDKYASFSGMKLQDNHKITQAHIKAVNVIKKIHNHIFEPVPRRRLGGES